MTSFDLSFNGVLASSLGVIVNIQPDRMRAKERMESITIPGRPGALHQTEGEDVFDVIILNPQCTLMNPAKLDAVCAWLRGSGKLIFGDDPNYCYEATVINQIPLARVLEGADPRSFAPTFECQPFRYLTLPAADIIKTSSGQTLNNPGTVASVPVIKVEGTGDVTLTVGGYMVTLNDLTGGIIIDGVMRDCLNLTRTGFLNNLMAGDFRYIRIPAGASTLSWTGNVTRVTVTPNWRWL